MDLQFLRQLLSDLEEIRRRSHNKADDNELRRTSVQLRQHICDDGIVHGWRMLGLVPKVPRIVAPKLLTRAGGFGRFALAGGADVGGIQIANMRIGEAVTPEEGKRLIEEERPLLECPFPIHDFKDSIAVAIDGKSIKRYQVIEYVANKLGGAHYDKTRNKKKDKEIYAHLDRCTHSLNNRGVVYLSILSIAQQVSSSPDIARLEEAIRRSC